MNNELENKEIEKIEQPEPIVIEEPEKAEPIVIEEPEKTEPIVIEEPEKADPIVIEETKTEEPTPVVTQQTPVEPAPVAQPTQQLPPTNNKQGGNGLLIAIIIVLGIIAVVCITVFVMTNSNSNKENNNNNGETPSINEYENNNGEVKPTPTPVATPTPTTTPVATPTPTPGGNTVNNDTISYRGYTFSKIPGYKYTIDTESGYLIVSNSSTAVTFDVDTMSYAESIAIKDEIKAEGEKAGFIVTDFKDTTYNGVKIMSFVVKADATTSLLYYVAESPNPNNVFFGSAFNSSYTVDYSILNTVANIVKNTKQGTSTFSKTAEDKDVKNGFDKKIKDIKFQ